MCWPDGVLDDCFRTMEAPGALPVRVKGILQELGKTCPQRAWIDVGCVQELSPASSRSTDRLIQRDKCEVEWALASLRVWSRLCDRDRKNRFVCSRDHW